MTRRGENLGVSKDRVRVSSQHDRYKFEKTLGGWILPNVGKAIFSLVGI